MDFNKVDLTENDYLGIPRVSKIRRKKVSKIETPIQKESRYGHRTLIRSAELEPGRRIGLSSEVTYSRKPFLRLEQLYFSDGIIFNSINTWIELICSPGFNIDTQNEKLRKRIEDFLHTIEFEDEILPKIVQHMCVYGNAFVEIIYNNAGDKVVDLSDPLDPKSMDFLRDPKTNIPILDIYGNPKAYAQKVNLGKPLDIPADHMAHFRLYTLASSQLGIGLIEPIFWTALGKRNIDEKIAQQEFRRATPFVWVSVGDESHEPSPEEINDIHNAFKDITYKTDFVGPYWYKVQFISSDPSESSINAVKYFQDAIISGMGLPKAIVTGTGESENRAVLHSLIAVTQRRVSRIQRAISNIIENKVFKKICELEGYDKKEVPRMMWNEFSPESLTGKIDRLVKEVQVGLLVPDEDIQRMVRQWEKLPIVEKTEEQLDKNAETERPKES